MSPPRTRTAEYWAAYRKEWARKNRAANFDRVRASEREAYRKKKERLASDPAYREEYQRRHNESGKRHREKFPERVRARRESYYARNKKQICDKSTAWGRLNKDRRKASRDKWLAKNPSHLQEWHVKRKYGLTVAEYKDLKQRFGHACGCCSRPVNGRSQHVDHCHATGAVRGILCNRCNVAIGMLGDTVDGVLRAVRYLETAILGQEKSCA